MAARRGADAPAGPLVDADGEELREPAVRPHHAEGAVARAGEVGGDLGDAAQRVGQAEVAGDGDDALQEPVHPSLGGDDLLGALDELAQQDVEAEPARPAGAGRRGGGGVAGRHAREANRRVPPPGGRARDR